MPNVVIRDAALTDAPAIAELLTELGYPADAQRAHQILQQSFNDAGQRVLVGERDGHVVGFAAVTTLFYFHLGQRIARLASLVVRDAMRGQRVGEQLLQAAEQWAVAQGCEQLELTSSVKRERAHGFYRRAGYDGSAYRFVRRLVPSR